MLAIELRNMYKLWNEIIYPFQIDDTILSPTLIISVQVACRGK